MSALTVILVVELLAMVSTGWTNDAYIYRECRGKWASWSTWTHCSKSCDRGERSRQRVCQPRNNVVCWGYLRPQCSGRASRTRECNTQPCSQQVSSTPYAWSAWGSWGSCSVSCGGGKMQRERSCEGNQLQLYGERRCSGQVAQQTSCSLHCCPVKSQWQSWASWSACSATCGKGKRYHTRSCIPAKCGGTDHCKGAQVKVYEDCSAGCCPVNSQWQSWSSWSTCSASCGQGKRYHTRSCVPAKCGGVSHCNGGQVKVYENCNAGCCPAAGYWTNWGKWSMCSVTCGTGIQKRIRHCVHPRCGGKDNCKGSYTEITKCYKNCCPISSYWKAWSAWSACSATCDHGVTRRYRICAGPLCGGQDLCGGVYNQTQGIACNKGCCPKNGYWKSWGGWSRCSATCGLGTKSRSRQCTASVCGGKNCVGGNHQTVKCGTVCCPKDGGWAAWGQWSQCSSSCGAGRKTRRRNCTPPKCGGKDYCVGLARQRVSCNSGCCPGTGNWTSWSGWSGCSVTCGSGTRTRVRQCRNSNTACKKNICPGPSEGQQRCSLRSCEPIELPPSTPTPAATGCRPPEKIANGFYTPVKIVYRVNDVVRYGCEIGFKYIGKVRLRCSPKGRWNRNPPECRRRE